MQKNTPSKQPFRGIVSLTARRIGFVANEKFEEDILIPEEYLNTALQGDEVEVELLPPRRGERQQGKILKIIVRKRMQFVGTIKIENGISTLIPDDRKMYATIIITKNEAEKLAPETKALVEIIWDNPRENPIGTIKKVLGKKGDHEVEMEAIILEKGFTSGFPENVEKEAEELKKNSSSTERDRAERRDMREIPTCTIDPANAKDFDDALSFRENEDGSYEIGVHIADVSHYVHEGTALDREAISRGVSVYLVDRTIPMLPHILSNDLCSLNPNEDKRTFSAIFTLDQNGAVKERWFGKTLMHSNKRFSYEEAQQTIESGEGIFGRELGILNVLAKKIKARRHAHGAIDFEEDEVQFTLDAQGKPIEIKRKVRLDAHKLIEEFMLLANREVAECINRLEKETGSKRLFVYRIHDMPNSEKMEELAIFLRAIGHELPTLQGKVSSKDLNALFKRIEGEATEGLIKTAALRAMSKAIYSTKNIGHFGLAFKYYTHFTSPIRRYPDIMVHRLLEKYLKHEVVHASELNKYHRLATSSTQQEIAATDAERASIKFKQVEYMAEHIGETFDAIISGVTEWGIYVEVVSTKAEGMIHIRNLGREYFELDQKNYRLIGTDTRKSFNLGDKLKVKLTGADIDARTLDFALFV
ncbi:MAG: ribonuclease R [Parcubacteria group bacterium Greene0416_14]|nr:MAG: ribonuclease R [Parcubacteria group bacterium Greene0416_14]TSD08027.1 MAG: ribonuclease R [Parcubacteria group bacterium Greene0714_4]